MPQSNLAIPDEPIWSPQEGSQMLFLSCPHYEALYEGTRGCMKTDTLIMDFAQHVGKGYGGSWRGIIFRNTYPQLEEIILRMGKWFPQIFPEADYNEGKYIYKWPTGERLYLRHMDSPKDYWNYHGHEYPFVGWDELTNWPTDECYELMKACCRSTDRRVPRKYRSTTNPYGVGFNWVKARFIDIGPPVTVVTDKKGRPRVRIHGDIHENKVLLEADPDYLKSLESIRDPNLRKAWLLGSWDIVAGGAIDDIWDERVHMFPYFRVPDSWYVDRSLDWGSSKPYSVGWWAESDGSEVLVAVNGRREVFSFYPGTLFRVAELYGWNGRPNEGSKLISTEVARRIREVERKMGYYVHPGPADNQIFESAEGRSIAEMMETQGIRWKKANKGPGTRVTGLERFREMLAASLQYPLEAPGMFVMENCSHFKRTVPTLPRDQKKMDDVNTEAEDHIWDDTRYRILDKKWIPTTAKLKGI